MELQTIEQYNQSIDRMQALSGCQFYSRLSPEDQPAADLPGGSREVGFWFGIGPAELSRVVMAEPPRRSTVLGIHNSAEPN